MRTLNVGTETKVSNELLASSAWNHQAIEEKYNFVVMTKEAMDIVERAYTARFHEDTIVACIIDMQEEYDTVAVFGNMNIVEYGFAKSAFEKEMIGATKENSNVVADIELIEGRYIKMVTSIKEMMGATERKDGNKKAIRMAIKIIKPIYKTK